MKVITLTGGEIAVDRPAAMARLVEAICRRVGREAAVDSVCAIPTRAGGAEALKALKRLEVVASATQDPAAVRASASAIGSAMRLSSDSDIVGEHLAKLALSGRVAEISVFCEAVIMLQVPPSEIVKLSKALGSASRLALAIPLQRTDEFNLAVKKFHAGIHESDRVRLVVIGAAAFSGSFSAGLAAARAIARIPNDAGKLRSLDAVSGMIGVIAQTSQNAESVVKIAYLSAYLARRDAGVSSKMSESVTTLAGKLAGSLHASNREAIACMVSAISNNFGDVSLSLRAMHALKGAWDHDHSIRSFVSKAAILADACSSENMGLLLSGEFNE